MTQSRSHDSSSPIMNIIMLMPSSAIDAISSCWFSMMAPSSGTLSANSARPNGPTAMPTRMKPSTGLSRSRWNSGITMAAAARMIRAGLNSPGST